MVTEKIYATVHIYSKPAGLIAVVLLKSFHTYQIQVRFTKIIFKGIKKRFFAYKLFSV